MKGEVKTAAIESSTKASVSARPTGNYYATLGYLLLCISAIFFYALETDLHLFTLFGVALVGFGIHPWLPTKWRLPFVFILNVVALPLLFGPLTGLLILLFALLLYGTVNLEVSVYVRAGLCLGLGGLLGACKLGFFPFPELETMATVVGGLFMFRSMVFLYELHHQPELGTGWQRLNYFFLLPNLIFVIFPVVDFKTFVRTWQSQPSVAVYEKGIWWIMRGLFHLLLYRLIYYYLVPSPGDIDSIFGVIRYMVTAYLMIVRLSGIFHLSTGILCLFGFNLPPTFDNYFLATGFSDLWRRINIYWKDFVMKLFYFPLYFMFRKRNETAIFVTIMVVFIINWLLHQYQWFWIKGAFPLTWVDAIFWLVFGLLVGINSIYQARHKKKKQAAKGFSIFAVSITCLQVIGMFTFMSVLWSFWSSPGVGPWLEFVGTAFPVSFGQLLYIALGYLVLYLCGLSGAYVSYRAKKAGLMAAPSARVKAYSLFWVLAVFLALPPIYQRVESALSVDLGPVRESRLNNADAQRQFQGYYETLLVGNDLSTIGMVTPSEDNKEDLTKLKDHGTFIDTDYGRDKRLAPNADFVFKKARLRTNSFGLRDRAYTKEKPIETLRVALLGGSSEMGSGVNDGETFENITEDALNVAIPWSGFSRVEILNFALSGMKMTNQVVKIHYALDFQPDVVVYAIHPGETARGLKSFAGKFHQGRKEEERELWSIFDQAGLEPGMGRKRIERLLQPFSSELAAWTAKQIFTATNEKKAIPVMLFVPVLGHAYADDPVSDEDIKTIFKNAGFLVVDLSETYKNHEFDDLQVTTKDNHPNALAHQLMADALVKKMTANGELARLLKARLSQ